MYIGKIPEGYFEFRNKVAKNNFNDCWQSMRNKYLSCGGQIPDYIIDELVFTYAEEYHRAELLKLNKSDVISSVCICECGKEASCPICRDCFKKGLERECLI